jgi:hypothetical protein
MSHLTTIGLISHTGRISSHIYNPLVKAQEAGQVRLVVLHRSSSDISNIPKDMETRVLDLEKEDAGEMGRAIKGINVLM